MTHSPVDPLRFVAWFLLLVVAVSAAPSKADVELLQNIGGRSALSLDGDWHVIPDPYENGYYNHRFEPKANGYFLALAHDDPTALIEYEFRKSPTLAVPGDWNSQDERYFLYEGTMWYFRAFDARPREGYDYLLHFGAANYTAEVWLNGVQVGSHEGGFTPFQFTVSELLKTGENFVVVKVDNRRDVDQVPTVNTDWWNYGGLTRSVNLVEVPEAHVIDYRVGLGGDGRISGWVRVAGAGGKVALTIAALDIEESLQTDDRGVASFSIPAEPERWSPENPALYDIELRYGEEKLPDRIGFRTLRVQGEDILLNDRPVFLRGISIHEEAPGREGRAYSEADARELLGRALELNCNFVRLAHYPHNEYMLRVADELGLMVWAEIPVYWTIDFESDAVLQKAQRQLGEMISRDRNRASVILWSMANETPTSAARLQFISALAAHARELDGSRLITAALDTQSVEDGQRVIDDPLAGIIDVIGINSYCGWYSDRPADCAALRWQSPYAKPVIMSEFGAGALHGLHGDRAHRWTEEYQADVYRYNLEMLSHIGALRGMSPWILQDFRSPRRPLPEIQDFWNRKGLLSEQGEKKAAWYLLRDFYAARAGAAR